MKRIRSISAIILVITGMIRLMRNNRKMETKDNPLICDIETGVCETPEGNADTSH
ncbi:MAG: hypothetical protein ACI8SE_001524 [Bacteroidia bacterium]|jgi:hypothetical protein